MKKTTSVRAMQRNANSARTNGAPRPRSNSASARLAISAPIKTMPNRLQPRYALHDEILLRHQVDLVGEREQMRAARYQRKRGERERKELNDFKGHDRNSAEA